MTCFLGLYLSVSFLLGECTLIKISSSKSDLCLVSTLLPGSHSQKRLHSRFYLFLCIISCFIEFISSTVSGRVPENFSDGVFERISEGGSEGGSEEVSKTVSGRVW